MQVKIEKCEGVNKCWYKSFIGEVFEVENIEASGLNRTKIFVKLNKEDCRRCFKENRKYAAVYKNDVKIINE